MQNEFAPYESDFQLWVESGFQPSKPETADYLRFLARIPTMNGSHDRGGLWRHQWDALLRTVYSREVLKRSRLGRWACWSTSSPAVGRPR